MKMSQFDYQSIIEACGIQDVNIKEALKVKNGSITKFQEHFINLKRLNKERDQKSENLSQLKLTLKKNLQKLNETHSKSSVLNKELKVAQNEISQLNLELLQKSNEFVKKMATINQELKTLYSQFKEETLTNILTDLNTTLISVQDTEQRLEREYAQLKQSPIDLSGYERSKILKDIINDVPETKTLEDMEKKLANKKRNIQFLSAEYNKKMEMLQTFI